MSYDGAIVMGVDFPIEWFSWHGLMSAVGLLIYALGSHALNQRRHPAAAVAWVMMIVLLPENQPATPCATETLAPGTCAGATPRICRIDS